MTIVCCHERVGWPADLDLFGMLGIRGRREHAAYGFDGVAARPLVQRAGVPVEPEQPFDRAKADSAERSSSGGERHRTEDAQHGGAHLEQVGVREELLGDRAPVDEDEPRRVQ